MFAETLNDSARGGPRSGIRGGDAGVSNKHAAGIQLYREGRFGEALATLDEALSEQVCSEMWNDWAAAHLACGHRAEAEEGFRRALTMDGGDSQAAANLGMLLAGLDRAAEAIPFLERAAMGGDAAQRTTSRQLLAACRAEAGSDGHGGSMREVNSQLRGNQGAIHIAAAQPTVVPGAPSKVASRATEGWLVYKPDFVHVPAQAAELCGGQWAVKADHAVGTGDGATLRWSTVASRVYALLLHFPWGGEVAVTVDGVVRNVVDLYSHATYAEPLEVLRSAKTSAMELQLCVVGQNPLARASQLGCFGFLVGRESGASEKLRVETDEGFLAIQKQQVVNWLASIKNRGLTLEEVTQQRKGAYTIHVSEGMAFMPPRSRILDIGCGYTFKEILRDVILSRGIEYWLQDIDPAVCNANAELFSQHGLPARQIFCGDNTDLPYPNGHFQGVFSSHCLEHSKDLERTFTELRRIIAPGGTLVFAVPRSWDRAEEHIYAPIRGGWEAFTERHGFKVISANLGCYYPEGGEYDLMVVGQRN